MKTFKEYIADNADRLQRVRNEGWYKRQILDYVALMEYYSYLKIGCFFEKDDLEYIGNVFEEFHSKINPEYKSYDHSFKLILEVENFISSLLEETHYHSSNRSNNFINNKPMKKKTAVIALLFLCSTSLLLFAYHMIQENELATYAWGIQASIFFTGAMTLFAGCKEKKHD